MVQTLGTVTAAGSAPFYTNTALFNTQAASKTTSSSSTLAPFSTAASSVNSTVSFVAPQSTSSQSIMTFFAPQSAPMQSTVPFRSAGASPASTSTVTVHVTASVAPHSASASSHRSTSTTTVTVTVPFAGPTSHSSANPMTQSPTALSVVPLESFVAPHSASALSTVPFVAPHSDSTPSTVVPSESFSRNEVQPTYAPAINPHPSSSVLKTALVSGVVVSTFIVLALIAFFLMFYFKKPRVRGSRGDPEAPVTSDGFELSTFQRQYLQCGPSNGACAALAPKPCAVMTSIPCAPATSCKPPRTAKQVVPQPSAAAPTRLPMQLRQNTRPAPPQQPTQAEFVSIPLSPSLPPAASPCKDSPVKPRRKTSKEPRDLAEELGLAAKEFKSPLPRKNSRKADEDLDLQELGFSSKASQAKDEDLELPELQFSSVSAHPVTSPVLSSPDSGVGKAVHETWGADEPSEQAKQFYKTVRQAKKKGKELRTRKTQSS